MNGNGVDDSIDILTGTSADVNGNGIPDEAEACLAPQLTAKANSQVVQLGDTVSLGVAATGTAPLSYHWSLAGVPMTDGGTIIGALTAALTIQGVAAADLGDCSVTITNACGEVTSVPATLSTDATALPIIASPEFLAGNFQFVFDTKDGRAYIAEYTSDLAAPLWTPMQTVAGDGSSHLVIDPGPLPAKRFYRLRVTNP
ncbi:MAG: immunoglobulin domain-containing protein [Verrucomicrobia bacterium]|nr:immunoglobulin domain-containing protein [Verrucomicrobiota bacterium]